MGFADFIAAKIAKIIPVKTIKRPRIKRYDHAPLPNDPIHVRIVPIIVSPIEIDQEAKIPVKLFLNFLKYNGRKIASKTIRTTMLALDTIITCFMYLSMLPISSKSITGLF